MKYFTSKNMQYFVFIISSKQKLLTFPEGNNNKAVKNTM